MKCQDAHQAEA